MTRRSFHTLTVLAAGLLSAAAGAVAAEPLPASTPVMPPPLHLAPRADGAMVWEAEWANRLSGSWACLPMKGAAGDAALWAREGSGRGSAPRTLEPAAGEALKESPLDLGVALYCLDIAKAGTYDLWMRVRAEDGCGDSCFARFDDGPTERYPGHANGRYPFRIPEDFGRWVWVHDAGRRDTLAAGPHILRLDVREDGFAMDQIALLPVGAQPPATASILTPSCAPPPPATLYTSGTPEPATDAVPAFALALAAESHILQPDAAPAATAWIWLRSNAPAPVKLTVAIECAGARLNPDDRINVTLTPERPIARFPVRAAFGPESARTGHMLAVAAECDTYPKLAPSAALELVRPLDWRAIGPLTGAAEKAADEALRPPNAVDLKQPVAQQAWKPVRSEHYTPLGSIDMNRLFGTQSHASAWLATRIRVARSGEYHLIAGGDDSLELWCDGQRLMKSVRPLPLTDTLRTYRAQLAAGDHLLLAHTTQQEGYWLVHVEFRSAHGEAETGIGGLPAED